VEQQFYFILTEAALSQYGLTVPKASSPESGIRAFKIEVKEMKKAKKFINNPKNIVPEILDGLIYASNGHLKRVDGLNAVMVGALPPGKVGLLIGGRRARTAVLRVRR
jgi:hypothetical protein